MVGKRVKPAALPPEPALADFLERYGVRERLGRPRERIALWMMRVAETLETGPASERCAWLAPGALAVALWLRRRRSGAAHRGRRLARH